MVNLKTKVDAGADFIITQLFFNNDAYFDFVDEARSFGLSVPIIPGIMPIVNLSQIKRFTKMCGASIPAPLMASLELVKDDAEKVKETGVAYAKRHVASRHEALRQGIPDSR